MIFRFITAILFILLYCSVNAQPGKPVNKIIYPVYEDGLTVHIVEEGNTSTTIFRLQWRPEEQAEIIDRFSDYVVLCWEALIGEQRRRFFYQEHFLVTVPLANKKWWYDSI